MTFRNMEPGDRDAMQSFYDDMGLASKTFFNLSGYNEKRTMDFFSEEGKPNHEFWVMTEGDQIIGLSFIWDIGSMIPWFGIAVRDEWHGKHVGTAMLTNVLEILRERGCGGLLLTTAQNNYKGQGLYEKCGFERLGVHRGGEYLYIHRFKKDS